MGNIKILVIDGQGGGLGKNITEQIKNTAELENCRITAVGTNSTAAAAMLRGGADIAATGENAAVVNARDADIITGAIGICFADSMHGEISAKMAEAVCTSAAVKILLPLAQYNINIMGIAEKTMAQYIGEAVEKIKEIVLENNK